jgi:glycerol-3-phosphate dehydrogenase
MARTVEDVLARRIRVLFMDARLANKLAPKVAELMMKELDLDEIWKQNQVKAFSELAEGYVLKRSLNSVANKLREGSIRSSMN